MKEDNLLKTYEVGYVPGVFDLFHIGHLNLINKCKTRCKYLIVGVLTDELVVHFKKKLPYNSFEERKAIINALQAVDEVVPVDFTNTNKMDAWNRYHFDCHFSGNDHGSDWDEELNQLRAVGSNMEFFQYTLSTSSTRIKEQLQKDFLFQYEYRNSQDKRIVLFGSGYYFEKYMVEYGERFKPDFAVDSNELKWGTYKEGIKICPPQELQSIAKENIWLIICVANYKKIEDYIKNFGITDYRIFPEWYKTFILKTKHVVEKQDLLTIEEKDYLKKAHEILMKLLLEFDRFCKKYDLKYYLICGSLLGAVRHKALIPWDDDVDVAMDGKEYEKFCKYAKEELNNDEFQFVKYNEMGKDVFLDFMNRLIYMKEEIPVNIFNKIQGKGRSDLKNHMALDIYVLENAAISKRKHNFQTKMIQCLYGLAMGHRAYVDYSEYENTNKQTRYIVKVLTNVGKMIPLNWIFFMYERLRRKYRKYEGSDYFESNGWIYCIPWLFPKKWFGQGTEVELYGNKIMAPEGFEDFLKMHYGNYMSLPPLEKRKPTHSITSSGIYH